MAFSGALTLTDLDDFLAPSQACILPVRQTNKVNKQEDGSNANTEIHIDENNNYYEVAISAKPSTAAEPPTLRLYPEPESSTRPSDGNAGDALKSAVSGIQAMEGGVDKPVATGVQSEALQKAEISLNDCLACSGCVTSTESMLITLQSHLEVQAYIASHRAYLGHNMTVEAQPNTDGETKIEPDGRTGIISISPQTLASLSASYGSAHGRSIPLRTLLRRIRYFLSQEEHGQWTGVWDTTFARHLSLLEHVKEYKERRAVGKGKQPAEGIRSANNAPALPDSNTNDDPATSRGLDPMTSARGNGLPMLASACPGWVCYAEKAHGELLGFVSAVRSSQGVAGALAKQWWGAKHGRKPNEIYHVTVMPCYDKKLEASRSDFYSSVYQTRDVDCVLTTGELDLLLRERGFDPWAQVPGEDDDLLLEDPTCPFPELLQHPGTSSGSYLHVLLAHLAQEHPNPTTLTTRAIRGSEDHVEFLLVDTTTGEIIFKGAKCYGFRNLQNLVRKVGKETGLKGAAGGKAAGGKLAAAVAARRRAGRTGRASAIGAATPADSSGATTPVTNISPEDRTLDYVEVMACPGGCVNGGGQMKPNATSLNERQVVSDGMNGEDEEGYPRVWEYEGVETNKPDPTTTQIDESMRWSTKAWVAKVEAMYWSDLPTPPASPPLLPLSSLSPAPPPLPAADPRSSGSLKPFESLQQLHDLSSSRAFTRADDLAKEIITDVCKPASGRYEEVMDDEAERNRWEFLRTRYRKVETEVGQLTASAVKW
ncbi:hypothetical protein QFC22_005601 [Naganishia vaughanmartiniae]|uniref:Uncharacterized protein n=1 Tax=Naganishia vaughanmartiniae TaxID=1424756 RepID=A0ACC2WTT4_9TREE|nr:hypothetical protein QFC22_005601 [Naganishia vaughanmartiniae]